MQRYVSATLYEVLGGPNWEDSANWQTGADVCEWSGVECFSEADASGDERRLQADRTIRSIALVNNGLVGWLPPDIVSLTSLEELELHRNDIGGEIPPQLYEMTTLKTLFLDDNDLEGPLSADLGKLGNLESRGAGRRKPCAVSRSRCIPSRSAGTSHGRTWHRTVTDSRKTRSG